MAFSSEPLGGPPGRDFVSAGLGAPQARARLAASQHRGPRAGRLSQRPWARGPAPSMREARQAVAVGFASSRARTRLHPAPHPRPRAGCAPRGFGHAPLTSDDSSGPRPGDQSALSGTAECGAGRPQPPRACGLGGSAPSQLSGHTAQPPTNPSQNEATWRQRPRAGGRLCVRQAEARMARPPGAVGSWLGKVLSVPHTYGQGDRPAPSAQRPAGLQWSLAIGPKRGPPDPQRTCRRAWSAAGRSAGATAGAPGCRRGRLGGAGLRLLLPAARPAELF